MKNIYVAAWNFKNERDANGSDHFECASFDIIECVKKAKLAWDYQTSNEQSTRSLSVLAYSYDETIEDAERLTSDGYDPDAVLWDEGGLDIGQRWGD